LFPSFLFVSYIHRNPLKKFTDSQPFLSGGGEMGELTRSYDWSKTSIGPSDEWPISLRTLVQMMLSSRFPMLIFWGPQLVTFYNDAFRPSLGNNGKHPGSLGQRGEESWAESWSVIGPMIHNIMAGGEAVWFEDQKLPIYREGQMGYAYWTYSFSPLTDDTGAVSGVLVTCSETTKAVESFAQLQQSNTQLQQLFEQNQALRQEEQVAQQQLRHSQQQLATLFEQSPVAIAIISEEALTFRMVNPFYCQLVDRRREDLLDKSLLEALPELVGQGFDQLLRQVIQTGTPFIAPEVSVNLLREDRLETIFVDLTYQPRREADGCISGVFVVATDVTQQVLARQVLESSEARFRSLIEQAPIAVCMFVGREMHIEIANHQMVQLWGKGPAVLGKPLGEALPELKEQAFLDILDEVYTTGEPYAGQAVRADLVVDGAVKTSYFDFTYQPIRNASGQVYAIMDVAIDVTEEVLLRQQFEQTQQALQNAVDLSQLGIWQIDVATQHADFSQQVIDWVGGSKPLTLQDAVAAIDPADVPRFEDAFRRAHLTESDGRLDIEYRLKNVTTGKEYLIHSMGQMLFDKKGNPLSLYGFSRDVTQLRAAQLALETQVQERTQELLLANGDLLRSNANLQQFAYVASHDLQEPLRKIQSFSSLLSELYGPQLGDGGQDLLGRINGAGVRMSQLIKDLLAYSRIATRQQIFDWVELDGILGEVLTTLEIRLAQSGARIEREALPRVRGDRTQLNQLFQNLLANALKFTPADQTPLVKIRCVDRLKSELPTRVRPTSEAALFYEISVSDEGIGFDEVYLDRIFQVFQRLHGKSAFEGTGVGLAICQRVVENHGGAITATSQPGQGATFCVYLPVYDS